MKSFQYWQDKTLLLDLYVQPNTKKDEVVGKYDDKLKLRISAPAVDNKAYKHLIKFIAKLFDTPASRIKLIKGENQRNKRVKIVAPLKLPEFINPPSPAP